MDSNAVTVSTQERLYVVAPATYLSRASLSTEILLMASALL